MMKPRRAYITITILFSILVVSTLAISNWAFASSPSTGEELLPQVIPTETPLVEQGEGVLTTNPALLQVIILLGIVAVLIIFIGVWINRSKVTLR